MRENVDKVLPNLLVLLMHEARHLFETFLVVSLGTEVDDVSGQTGHASFTIPRKERRIKELVGQMITWSRSPFQPQRKAS